MPRVALIGYGYAGRTFHAPLIRATPGFELIAVCSSQAGRVHADLPDIPVVRSPDEACRLPDVDLVVIATPHDSHVALAARALLAGKHVVVEKPVATTLEEARRLAAAARDTDRVVAVFHSRRWDGDFLAITDLLNRSALGNIAHFESHFDRFRPIVRDRWRERAGPGGGLWYDLGPHLVDQALQLFGLPDRVTANLAAQRSGAQSDDWAHAVLEYGQRRVILHASVLVAAPVPRFAVHGDAGSWIKYGVDGQERRLIAALTPDAVDAPSDDERAVSIDGISGTEREMPIARGDYRQFYVELAAAVRGAASNPVPLDQALAVVAVVETAIRSSAERRALTVPLTDEEIARFNVIASKGV
jgi:predicted dehydrogenase